ncbi:MAG: hypothetical protein OHK0039_25920 [Bacteroidia bacterium]
MKSIRFTALLLTALLAATPLSAQLLDWFYEDMLTDLRQSGANPDLCVDAGGDLHVSYWKAGDDRLAYARRDKTTGLWSVEEIPDGGTYGYKSAIALDAAGKVHIAFLHNDAGAATLKYATNRSGTWVVEEAFDGTSLGAYGPDQAFPTYIQHAVDIVMQGNDEPAILVFNGDAGNTVNCQAVTAVYQNYELNMHLLYRQGGSWVHHPFADVPYTGGIPCLSSGDRYGEFCQMLPTDGGFVALTNAVHNHQLLLYQSGAANLQTWTWQAVDSTSRFFATISATHFWESFGFIDAAIGPGNTLHMAYSVSVSYGYGGLFTNRQPMFYTRIRLDSLGQPGYTPYHYAFAPPNRIRSGISLALTNNDSVYIAYFGNATKDVVVAGTSDGGLTWQSDTLFQLATNASLQLAVSDDSLLLLSYDADDDHLILSGRSLSGGTWRHSDATRSERRGRSLSSLVHHNGSDDEIYAAFTEDFDDQLYVGRRIQGAWTYEALDTAGRGLGEVNLTRSSAGLFYLLYSLEADSLLRLGVRSGTIWSLETVATGVLPRDVQVRAGADSLHVCYFDLSLGNLWHLSRAIGGGAWRSEIVDASSAIVGRRLNAVLAPDGTLHLSYLDALNARLRYARRAPGGAWETSDVTPPLDFNPSFNSLRVGTHGRPAIAFRDATGNRIMLAEQQPGGTWQIGEIESQPSNLVGAPLRLLLDASDRPWVLYNFPGSINGMRLARRDDSGDWHAVSVGNNSAEIANVFDFHLSGLDFYIVGQKTQLENKGLGLLHAPDGVTTWLRPGAAAYAFELAPNPAQQQVRVSYRLPAQQPLRLALYNLAGQQVHLVREAAGQAPGDYAEDVDLRGLAPGYYLVRLQTADAQVVRNLLVLPD